MNSFLSQVAQHVWLGTRRFYAGYGTSAEQVSQVRGGSQAGHRVMRGLSKRKQEGQSQLRGIWERRERRVRGGRKACSEEGGISLSEEAEA